MNFSLHIGSIDLQKFIKKEKIGSGGFGIVYKVYEVKTEKIFAAKISILEIDNCQNDTVINLSREINIISQLNHPCILQYIGSNPNNFKNKPKPVIITEYASNNSLEEIIKLERICCGNHEWNDTKKLINIYGIAYGMAYLHKKNIIHRDLKPANILLDDYLFPKIADFGLSKVLSDEDEDEDEYNKTKRKLQKNSGFKGTLAYCAPEILKDSKYTKKGDVYSFGMIVYQIMTNDIPFEGLNQFQFLSKMNKRYRPILHNAIPYCYMRLIDWCWSENPKFRPDFDKIVKLLENNKSFLLNNVNEDEYQNYIYFVKEQENLNDQQTKPIISKQQSNFNKVSFIKNNSEVLDEPDYSKYAFLDLTKYERKEVIIKDDYTKLYKFQEKGTDNIYFGQMSMIKIKTIKDEDLYKLSKYLKIIKELKHPSLLKFIGYSPIDFKKQLKPVIVTEFISNISLENILDFERKNDNISGWDDTKKLIVIYGIASGMSYLHSKNIIHCNLKPSSVYLDDILTPKLGDFGLSKRFENSNSITLQSISGIKATPIYSSPEVLKFNKYSKSSDVYSFSLIVYEIICKQIPFCEINNNNQIFDEIVIKRNRPIIKDDVPKSYCDLINLCWSQEPNERPSFDDIVSILKKEKGFITSDLNYEYYQKYINFIEDQIKSQKVPSKIQENSEERIEFLQKLHLLQIKKEAEKGNTQCLEYLAKKYILENDSENIYIYFLKLINAGKCTIPLEYAINLYKKKYYTQAFNYFSLICKINHPIALFYIGVMKYFGRGCMRNQAESNQILKHLSEHGIDSATAFLEEHFGNN